MLRLKRASRISVGLWMGYAAFLLAFFAGFGAALVISGLFGDQGAGARLVRLFIGVGLLAMAILPAVSFRDQLRAFRERDPHLRVGTDGLTVWHRGVFVDPQLISASVIRNIAIGPGVTRSFVTQHHASRVILAPDIPPANALLRFRQPVLLDRAFGSLSYSRNFSVQPPRWDGPVEEVWLALDDPESSYRVLREWNLPVEWDGG